jgi:L-amino acid N-acyltransferase YncA
MTQRATASAVLEAMTQEHWPAVRDIYAEGIATGHATFETEPPSWESFDRSRLSDQRLVAVNGENPSELWGWVAASPVSDRCVYTGVVEHSVYVARYAQGQGVGRLLLEGLVRSTESAGIWTIQSGIFAENASSLALHATAGFRVVGTRSALGLMTYGPLANRWRDVIMVERRSTALPR